MAIHLLQTMRDEKLLRSSGMPLLYEILSPERQYNDLAVSVSLVDAWLSPYLCIDCSECLVFASSACIKVCPLKCKDLN